MLVLFAATSYFLYRLNIKKLGEVPTFADYCEKTTFGKLNPPIFLNGIFGFIFLLFIQPISDLIGKIDKSYQEIIIWCILAYIAIQYFILDPLSERAFNALRSSSLPRYRQDNLILWFMITVPCVAFVTGFILWWFL